MTTHFITAEINLQEVATPLPEAVEAALRSQGEPLRWAITAVAAGTAQVEAVVTRATRSETEVAEAGITP